MLWFQSKRSSVANNLTSIIISTLETCESDDSGCNDTHQKGEEEEELCPYPPPGLGTTAHSYIASLAFAPVCLFIICKSALLPDGLLWFLWIEFKVTDQLIDFVSVGVATHKS